MKTHLLLYLRNHLSYGRIRTLDDLLDSHHDNDKKGMNDWVCVVHSHGHQRQQLLVSATLTIFLESDMNRKIL